MSKLSRAECQRSRAIVGQSPDVLRLRAEIRRVAPFASNVLITGPSGTGKELVARQIHALSPRARQPFIPVDCASMTGELMSSQLFGHVAGAFTGASCDALGCFRAANHGTLFLDEIGELELALQAKLLRVLQERVVTPVGSYQGDCVDVRVVTATNRDLHSAVLERQFREDLYYRLDVVHLRTTHLRDRPNDISVLADEFLSQLADEGFPLHSLSGEALEVLFEFDWPGNVRQLRNVLEQAVIDSPASVIPASLVRRIISLSLTSCDGPAELGDSTLVVEPHDVCDLVPRPSHCDESKGLDSNWISLAQVEREHILRTLEHTFYNRSAAARLLGVTRQSLLRKMKRYELDISDNRGL
jgi:DNA-binding NtrC family response regulator